MLLEQAYKYYSRPDCKSVLDLGVGSGILLAAAAQLDVKALWGVDINPDAIKATASLLRLTAPNLVPHLLLGDMWAPLPEGQRYSLILANLPHFPGGYHDESRPLGWDGGNGRETINRLIEGLPERLAHQGLALITHQDLIGFEATCSLITHCGLRYETLSEWLVFEPPERMRSVNTSTLEAASADIKRYGGYAFMNARILKIFH